MTDSKIFHTEDYNFQSFSFIAYLLLFPVYLIYQILIALNIIPSFLGGYVSFVAISLFIPALLIFLNLIFKDKNSNFLLFTIGAYFLYILFLAVVSIISKNQVIIAKPLIDTILTIIFWTITISIFANFNYQNIVYKRINIFISIGILVFIFIYSISKGSLFALFEIFGGDVLNNISGIASYQGIGRTIFFMYLLLIINSRNNYLFFLISIIALLLIFISGSRTFFVATFLTYITIALLQNPIRNFFAFIFLTFFLSIITIISFTFFPEIRDLLSESRILEIFSSEGSLSWHIRVLGFEETWEIIKDNIFFGNFGHSIYESTGQAHNILAAWSNFGLVGFLLFSLVLLTCFFKILAMRMYFNYPEINFGLALITTTIFLQIFLEWPFSSFLPGAVIGYTIYLASNKKFNFFL